MVSRLIIALSSSPVCSNMAVAAPLQGYCCSISTPWHAAKQAVKYVMPSAPHTGPGRLRRSQPFEHSLLDSARASVCAAGIASSSRAAAAQIAHAAHMPLRMLRGRAMLDPTQQHMRHNMWGLACRFHAYRGHGWAQWMALIDCTQPVRHPEARGQDVRVRSS